MKIRRRCDKMRHFLAFKIAHKIGVIYNVFDLRKDRHPKNILSVTPYLLAFQFSLKVSLQLYGT